MLLKVYNASCYDETIKPIKCIPCFKKSYDWIEVRTFKSFEEFDSTFGSSEGTWLSKGSNHRINEEGFIERTFKNEAKGWFVEINSIEELMELKEKIKSPITLSKDWSNRNITLMEFNSEE